MSFVPGYEVPPKSERTRVIIETACLAGKSNTPMSFLSSHRLHWGARAGHPDPFWLIREHQFHPSQEPVGEPNATARTRKKRRSTEKTGARQQARAHFSLEP